MKCLWYLALALLVGVSFTTSANAQADWGSSSQIGSYQSILSSYAQQAQGGSGSKQMPVQGGLQSTPPMQGAPIQGVPMGTPIQGAPIQGAPTQDALMQGAYQSPAFAQPSYVAPSKPMAPVQGGVVQGAPMASPSPTGAYQPAVAFDTGIPCGTGAGAPASFAAPVYSAPVSYTHLTLPTICSV